MDGNSFNITVDIIDKLKKIIPSAFTDDKLDISQLQQLLGENVSHDSEKYQLNWVGKNNAYIDFQTPSNATLLPIAAQSVNWDHTENIFIEGENLEALKVIQKSYYGKIKMIYIDPPYNTGSDSFIYNDKFSETKKQYLKNTKDTNKDGFLLNEDLFRPNKKENGHYHSNWLSMMMPRLFLAKNLLRDDGLIFISIDDNEVHNLRLLLSEIFGEENFIACFMWRRRKTQANLSKNVSPVHDYILCFAKNIEKVKFNKISYSKEFIAKTFSNPDNDTRGPYQTRPLAQPDNSSNISYEINLPNGRSIRAKWSCSQPTFNRYIAENRLYIPKGGAGMPRLKIFLSNVDGQLPNTWLDDIATNEEGSKEIEQLFGSNAFFTAPKPTKLIKHLLKLGSDKDDIILDFFAGSGSTAHAVLDLNNEDNGNRKFISIQLPEPLDIKSLPYSAGFKNIADISIKRIQLVCEKHNQQIEILPNNNTSQLIGFRVFKNGPSNFKKWDSKNIKTESELLAHLDLFKTSENSGATADNMLWEMIIKSGFLLSSKVFKITLNNCTLFHLTAESYLYTFDEISQNVISEIIKLKPSHFICLDSVFKNDDSFKINLQTKLQNANIIFKTI